MSCGTYTLSTTWFNKDLEELKSIASAGIDNEYGIQSNLYKAFTAVSDKFKEIKQNNSCGHLDPITLTWKSEDAKNFSEKDMLKFMGIIFDSRVYMLNEDGSKRTCTTENKTKLFSLASEEGIVASLSSTNINFAANYVWTEEELKEIKYEESQEQTATNNENLWTGNGELMAAYWVMNNLTSETILSTLVTEKQFVRAKPLKSSINDLVGSTLRSIMSTEDGDIKIWYPDRWGECRDEEGNLTAIKEVIIDDMELINITAVFSMEGVYTHVYCRGGTLPTESIDELIQWTNTTGLVFLGMRGLNGEDVSDVIGQNASSEEAATATQLADSSGDDSNVLVTRDWLHLDAMGLTQNEFYKTFGLKPKIESGISNSLYYLSIQPFIYCLDKFLEYFSSMYTFKIDTTFMPEIKQGMRVRLKSYDVSLYVNSVTHSMSYSGGFSTTLSTSCPSGTMLNAMVNYQEKEIKTLKDDDFKE